MQVTHVPNLSGATDISARRPTIATIGAFDGVHRGHAALLSQVIEKAKETGSPSTVFTFDRLPEEVLRGAIGIALTDLDEKLRRLECLGVDDAVVLSFTSALASLDASYFIELLLRAYPIRSLWVGADFKFGRARGGDVELLLGLGKTCGFTVNVFQDELHEGVRISSSEIRSLIREGRLEEAGTLLGYQRALHGPVVRGHGRGRALGYPTANVSVPDSLLKPALGIYAGEAYLGSEKLTAAISIGRNPQFGGQTETVEAYLLDFDRDIYDQELRVVPRKRLREERTFATVSNLIHQMGEDVAQSRRAAVDWSYGNP
jgi:riboflavin kinase/FMN adenylyltransferase